jgi:hypothetical protein
MNAAERGASVARNMHQAGAAPAARAHLDNAPARNKVLDLEASDGKSPADESGA